MSIRIARFETFTDVKAHPDTTKQGNLLRASIGRADGEPTDCPCGCDRRDGGTGFYITVSDGERLISVSLTPAQAKQLRERGVIEVTGITKAPPALALRRRASKRVR